MSCARVVGAIDEQVAVIVSAVSTDLERWHATRGRREAVRVSAVWEAITIVVATVGADFCGTDAARGVRRATWVAAIREPIAIVVTPIRAARFYRCASARTVHSAVEVEAIDCVIAILVSSVRAIGFLELTEHAGRREPAIEVNTIDLTVAVVVLAVVAARLGHVHGNTCSDTSVRDAGQWIEAIAVVAAASLCLTEGGLADAVSASREDRHAHHWNSRDRGTRIRGSGNGDPDDRLAHRVGRTATVLAAGRD